MDRWRILTELANIKKNTTELKNTITEMKNAPEGINSRLDCAEEGVSDLEGGAVKSSELNRERKKRVKNEASLRDFYNNITYKGPRMRKDGKKSR